MPEQGVNSFSKGLNTDSSVLNQPEGTYRYALNSTLLNDNGEYHAISNEKGTSNYVGIPLNYNVIGHTVVDDEIILCLVDSTNNLSQIGIVEDGVYSKKVPVLGEDNSLNFNINNPIDIVGRKLFNGDTIIYFTDNLNPISVLNLNDPPENISKGRGIIPEINLATISVDRIINGGNLKAGVVQFMVRYLNKELVPTITTPPTNPIPILGSDVNETDISKIFGGEYNAEVNKAVKLNISNLDTDYPFFELIAVEYEGATSAPKVLIANTYEINSTSVKIVYSGQTEDSVITTIDEVISDPITYDKAKCVEQKDGRLFFSNLSESKSRYRNELQEVANNVTINYNAVIKDKDYYSDALISMNNKTYRRGEVYSFGIGVVFKDGSTSYVYHIPGLNRGTNTPGRYLANSTSGNNLGTYISEESYPLGQGYPNEFGNDTNIRHHLMPLLRQQPTTQSDLVGSVGNLINKPRVAGVSSADDEIVVLNLDFILNTPLSQELKDEIQEIILYREPRNSIEKRSRLAQGFATNVFINATSYQNEGKDSDIDHEQRGGDVINGSYQFKKNFGFFNMQLNTHFDMADYDNASESKTNFKNYQLSTHHGFYYSVKTLDETLESDPGTTNGFNASNEDKYQQLNWRMNTDKFCFMSPETLLGDGVFISEGAALGATLVKKAEVWCPYSDNNRLNSGIYLNATEFGQHNSKDFLSKVGNVNIHYVVQGFTTFYTQGTEEGFIKNAVYINNGEEPYLVGLERYKFDNNWSGKFLYLKTDQNIQQSLNTRGNIIDTDFRIGAFSNVDELVLYNEVGQKQLDSGNSARTSNHLDMFSIENNIRSQYGRIENSQYVPILRTKSINDTVFSNVYSGDTYITEYTIVNKNLYNRFFPFGKSASNNVEYWQAVFNDEDDDGSRIVSRPTIMKNSYNGNVIQGSVYGAAVTYYVESDINCFFRHRNGNESPYYPESDISTVFSAIPNQEDNRSYNVQYSLDNVLKTTYVSRPLFDEAITTYPNRTIYSDRSLEDSKVDEYQIFRQNNFYDLPEETGQIVDTFVWNNDLYSHTPKSLWRNFVNTVTREANTIGEVVLGTGGLFQLDSQKVLTSDGGYGGTLSQFGNCATPFGYFFVDLLQRKVFRLSDNLEEISLQGMHQFFDNNLKVNKLSGKVIDNTFNIENPLGLSMGWDNEYKRIILTQHSNENSFTISYSPLNKGWVSFHSYLPNTYITYDKFIYGVKDFLFHEFNTGDYGVYFNEGVFPLELDIVSNKLPAVEKAFDNYNIHSRSYNNGVFENLDTFTSLQCRNDYQDSGILSLLTTNDFNPIINNSKVLTRWKKSHFQIYIPRHNHEFNLLNDWESASRLKSKYLRTKFTYDNLNNREFIVNFIEYFFRPIAR